MTADTISRFELRAIIDTAAWALDQPESIAVRRTAKIIDRIAYGAYATGKDCGCPLVAAHILRANGETLEGLPSTPAHDDFIERYDSSMRRYFEPVAADRICGTIKVVDE